MHVQVVPSMPPAAAPSVEPTLMWLSPSSRRYAAAVDSRGQFTGPLAKLPGWIQQSLQVPRGFGEAFGKLARFSRTMAAAEVGPAAAAAAAPAAATAAVLMSG